MVQGSRIKLGAYVAALHAAPSFAGRYDFHREHARHLGDERVLRRWRHSRHGAVCAFPSYTTESLGLSMVHLLIRRPDPRFVRFPYAVDRAWVTPDFVQRFLYLQCFVPTIHLGELDGLLSALRDQSWCSSYDVIPSQSGWQHLRECGHAHTLAAGGVRDERSLLRRTPLIVPLVMESWNRDATLTDLWSRISHQLGASVRSYLPNRRLRLVNGKSHVRAACDALATADLFRQLIVRQQAQAAELCGALIVGNAHEDRLVELVADLGRAADSVETFPATTGRTVVRVNGPHAIVRTLLASSLSEEQAPWVFLVDQERTRQAAPSRFAYESLFDPKTGSWVFPRDRIMEHLTSQ